MIRKKITQLPVFASYLKNYTNKQYEKWNRLKLLVSTTETNTFRIYYVSLKMVFSVVYSDLLNKITNNNAIIVGRHVYQVDYTLNSRSYSMMVTPTRGPNPISNIINQNGENITDQILPFMGPKYDWHGHVPKASLFGHTKIIIQNHDGTETEIL